MEPFTKADKELFQATGVSGPDELGQLMQHFTRPTANKTAREYAQRFVIRAMKGDIRGAGEDFKNALFWDATGPLTPPQY